MQTKQLLWLLFLGAVFSLNALSADELDTGQLKPTKIDCQAAEQYSVPECFTDDTIETSSIFLPEKILETRDNLGHLILAVEDKDEVHPLFEIVEGF